MRTLPALPVSNGPVLVVLALQCATDPPDLVAVAESLSEELLYRVGQVKGIRVFGRASSFTLTGDDRKPARVATLLDATHVLDGKLWAINGAAHLFIELSSAPSGVQLWSGRFDLAISPLPDVAGNLARMIADALKLSVSAEPTRATLDPVAFDHYLRGRQLTGPASTRTECIEAFEAALEIDPDYAAAWSSLALARALKARWDVRERPFAELKAEAIAAARRALALDPASGPAQIALGILEPWAQYSVRERRIQAAVSASPQDAEALRQQAEFAYCVGRIGEAMVLAERTHRMDPLNPLVVQNYANLISESGRPTEAFIQFALARARWPEIPWFRADPLMIAAFLGDWETVDGLLPQAEAPDALTAMAVHTANALRGASSEIRATALRRAGKSHEINGRVDVSTLAFLCGLGLTEEAFEFVDKSDFDHLRREDGLGHDMAGVIPGIIFGVANRPMRRDPRFLKLCAKLGLCSYWMETGNWPDCASEPSLPYDFRAEARQAFD